MADTTAAITRSQTKVHSLALRRTWMAATIMYYRTQALGRTVRPQPVSEQIQDKTLELPPDTPLVGGTPELNPPFTGHTLQELIRHIESNNTKVDRVDVIKQSFFKNIKISSVLNLGPQIHVNILLIPKETVNSVTGYFYIVLAYLSESALTRDALIPQEIVSAPNIEAAIRTQLVVLLLTRPGQRTFQPDYGCRLLDFTFEPITEATALRIESEIIQAVNKWLPQVIIKRVDVIPVGFADINVRILFEITKEPRFTGTISFQFLSGGKVEIGK